MAVLVEVVVLPFESVDVMGIIPATGAARSPNAGSGVRSGQISVFLA